MFSLVYNLTMNRLTKEQRLQIMEFYYQHKCSVKFIARFFYFLAQFDSLKRLLGLCCTLNHQQAYVECELKKISQLYRPVLMMAINY